MQESAPRSPNFKTRGEFVGNYAYRTTFFNSFLFIFVKHKLAMVSRVYATFYISLLKLACILLKTEVITQGEMTPATGPLPQFFSTENSFLFSFFYFFSGDVLLFQT